MTGLIRNPEIKKELIFYFISYVIIIITGRVIMGNAGFYFSMACGLFYLAAHFFTRYFHYKKLSELTAATEAIFHDSYKAFITDGREGELSALESQIRKLYGKLNSQTELLADEKKRLADSISDISHQIRTPLTEARLILGRLRDGVDNSTAHSMYRELDSLFEHIRVLTDTLLAMARLDAGTINLCRTPTRADLLVNDSLKPLIIPAELKQITITNECEDTLISIDSSWTAEAIENILKNSIEHTPAGGNIKISSDVTPLYKEIIISDNGSGFSAEDLPHLFERFYKGKNSSDRSVGIGLAFARAIVTNQDGLIIAGNNITGGAYFRIRFYESVL